MNKKSWIFLILCTLVCATVCTTVCTIGCTGKKRSAVASRGRVYATGIDLSHHNKGIEWNKLEVGFVFLKSTEGSDFKDSAFIGYRDSCMKYDIPVGAYHFFTCKSSGKAQFRNFKKTVGKKIDLKPVIDIEKRKGISKKKLQEEICDWIDECYDYYEVYPIIYTSDHFYIRNLKGNKLIEKCQVWLGDVNNNRLFTPHIIHQATIKKVPGTKYPVDYDKLYCGLEEISLPQN